MVNAEIKAQVTGYLMSKEYTEGSFVKKGQLLFQIDPRALQAALDQAKGDLAKAEGQVAQANGQLAQIQAQVAQAEANQGKTQMDVDRFTPLVKSSVISRQDYDTAVQANLASKAQVKAASAGVESAKAAVVAAKSVVESSRANVRTAELNLSFTKITSPVDGIAGIAQAQVGNLIQPINPGNGPLTTVSSIDPKVFTLSEQEYLLSNTARLNANGMPRTKPKLDLCWQMERHFRIGEVLRGRPRIGPQDRYDSARRVFRTGNVLARSVWKVRAVTRIKTGRCSYRRAITELRQLQVAVVSPENRRY